LRSIAPKLRSLFFAIFALGQIAAADWQVISSNDETSISPSVVHRHVLLRNYAAAESVTIDLALFSQKTGMLRVIDNAGVTEDLAGAMARDKCIAGVNGGYFDKNFKPIGLRMINGATTSPLVRARLLTGVICASAQTVEIVRLSQFSRKKRYDAALECGPFLVDLGMRVRGLDNSRKARRTFAAIARGSDAALGVSSDVSLADLSEALTALPDFKIWRALNLDGGSSSGFCFRSDGGAAFSIAEEKPVRDFIGVAPR
jgi:hypothetical protein